MKIKFRNPLTRENLEHPVSPSGSDVYVPLKWRFDDEGNMIRKPQNPVNRYDFIQAARDSVDLQSILKRYENGDASALDKVQGMYIDTAELPKNYAELYNAVSVHNEVFDSMPIEIKEKFDNNPAKFWRNFGTEMFDNVINEYRESVYAQYGLVDENPVKTAPDIKEEEKVGEDNE